MESLSSSEALIELAIESFGVKGERHAVGPTDMGCGCGSGTSRCEIQRLLLVNKELSSKEEAAQQCLISSLII